MFLMIDNYDSFVYNLVRYFEELDEKVIVYRNDKLTIEDIEKMDLQGIYNFTRAKEPKRIWYLSTSYRKIQRNYTYTWNMFRPSSYRLCLWGKNNKRK